MRTFEFTWRTERGRFVAITTANGNDVSDALVRARRQMFARRFNPYELVYVAKEVAYEPGRPKRVVRKRVDISTEFDSQGDFWWNKL